MKLKYHGPIDEIEIPDGNHVVRQGDEFDTTPELAASLLQQVDNYAPADKDAEGLLKAKEKERAEQETVARLAELGLSPESTVAELKAYAETHEVDLGSASTKPALIAKITGTENEEA